MRVLMRNTVYDREVHSMFSSLCRMLIIDTVFLKYATAALGYFVADVSEGLTVCISRVEVGTERQYYLDQLCRQAGGEGSCVTTDRPHARSRRHVLLPHCAEDTTQGQLFLIYCYYQSCSVGVP